MDSTMKAFINMNHQLTEEEMQALIYRQQFDRDTRLKKAWLDHQVKATTTRAMATLPFQQTPEQHAAASMRTAKQQQNLQLQKKELEHKMRFPPIPRFTPQAAAPVVVPEGTRSREYSGATMEVRNKIYSDLDEYISTLFKKRMSKEDVRLSTAASSRGNMHGTHTPTISVADSHGNNDFYNDECHHESKVNFDAVDLDAPDDSVVWQKEDSPTKDAEDIYIEEVRTEVTPSEQVPIEDVPTEEVPINDVQAEEVPINDYLVEEVPTDGAPSEEIPAEIPIEGVLSDELPEKIIFKGPPSEEVPNDVVPSEEVPIDVVPSEEVPIDVVPSEEVPNDVVPSEEVPNDVVPSEDVFIDDAPSGEIPIEGVTSDEVPNDNVQSEEIPIDNIQSDEVPIDNILSDEVPMDEIPMDEVPADNDPLVEDENFLPEDAPVEDAPVEDAPVEDTPNDATAE